MIFGSLFSGIGGFDLGLERAGMRCAWQVERNKKALDILGRHWPEVGRYEDVRTISRGVEPVDLICGGFPCQDVSVAGRRAGLDGERSGLWFEFARIIDELEPRWVVVENVPGLLSSNRGADFAVIIQWLAKRGYGVAWRVLDAQYFGVAQRRRRVFIVAGFGDGRAAEVLFEREGVRWNFEAVRKSRQDVAYAITRGTSSGYRLSVEDNMIVDRTVWDFHRQDGTYRPQTDTAPTVAAKWGTGGNNVPFVGVRRLTPVECERLQGFPDGWTDEQADSHRYHQLGNAVAVPVAEWIGRRIMEVVE